MKNIRIVGIFIFLILINSIFVISASALESHLKTFNDYRYKWSHKSDYEISYNDTEFKNLIDSDYPINGYFAPVIIRSNKNNNFYQWTNSITLRTNENLISKCDKGTCQITSRFFVRDSNYNISDFDLLDGSNIYFGISNPRGNIKENLGYNEYFPCEYKKIRNDIYDVTCNVPIGFSGNGKSHIRVDLNNKPFEDITSNQEYVENKFYVGVSNNVNVDCLSFILPKLSVSVDGGTVTINVTNMEEFLSDTEFERFQVRHEHQVLGIEFSNDSSYVFENVPNGEYTFSISACKPGPDCGPRAYITYSVTTSQAPTPNVEVSDDGSDIILDGSSSRAYDGTSIKKYYYKIRMANTEEETDWLESTNSSYVFQDRDYGMYHIHFKVEDNYGNVSRELITSFSHRSPMDKLIISISNFMDKLQNGFTNFLGEVGSFILHIFIPEKSEFQNSIDRLENAFSQKLGFLGDSINFIIDELEYMLINPGPFTSICLPQTSLPDEMSGLEIIPEGSGCLTANIMSNFESVSLVIKAITSLLLIGWFVNYCYQELLKILGGVSVDYK